MDFNWLDWIIGGILLISFVSALRNGVTRELVRLVALAAGFVGAMWYYHEAAAELAPYISDPRVANFAAFAAIVLGCLLAGALLAWIFDKIWGAAGIRWFDRLLGGGFGILRGLAIATALVLGVTAFAPVAGSDRLVAGSQLAPWVLLSARGAAYLAPAELRNEYSAGFERVREAWTTADIPARVKRTPLPLPE